jgi:hypothetical protein
MISKGGQKPGTAGVGDGDCNSRPGPARLASSQLTGLRPGTTPAVLVCTFIHFDISLTIAPMEINRCYGIACRILEQLRTAIPDHCHAVNHC